MIDIQITGLEDVKKMLGTLGKQADFAASRALNTTAFKINAEVKTEMNQVFQGGATPYTLRAMKVEKSTKQTLTAAVKLRTDGPSGGTPYEQALGHLFTGGGREWKKMEGYLRKRGLMPSGLMAVPGNGATMDKRGNMSRAELREMLGSLSSSKPGMRTYRRSGGGKQTKAIGYFVILPGARSNLKPGIYKRIETGKSSTIVPMVMFVRPGTYRRYIDLPAIGTQTVQTTFAPEFYKELRYALETAK